MINYLFYVDQILFALISFISAKEEVNGTWAFREYAAPGTIQSKLYHRWGYIFIVLVGIISAFAFNAGFISFVLLCFLNAFIYWLLFDIWYAKGINQNWYYLGNEASSDKGLKKYFGKNVGKNKSYFCVSVIVILNVIHFFFK